MKMKKTLKIGIAPRQAIARYTRDVVAGRRRRSAEDPDVWFTSVESFAKVMSDRNRGLLALIAERRPESIDALAEASGRAKSNLSRTDDGAIWARATGEGRGPATQAVCDVRAG